MNTHHLAEVVRSHLDSQKPESQKPRDSTRNFLTPRLFHEPTLLGTGGALVNVAEFWGDDELLVWNGDIVADVSLAALARTHQAQGAEATLVMQAREGDSHLLVADTGQVCGIHSPRRGVQKILLPNQGDLRRMAFHGISMLSPRLRKHMPPQGAFDLIDLLLERIEAGGRVWCHDAGEAFYGTTGSPAKLARLEEGLAQRPDLLARWTP